MNEIVDPKSDGCPAKVYYDQSLDAYHQGNLEEAAELCLQAASLFESAEDSQVSLAYDQLGVVAYRQGDYDAAEQWYRKALDVEEKNRDEHAIAYTCHLLSRVANGRGDFKRAEKWLHKAIQISEKLGDDADASANYHQLGTIAYQREDFDAAEQWYRKSLEIDEQTGDEVGAAKTYNNLSAVANRRHDYDSAEQWLEKSIRIKREHNDQCGLAASYHQLGIVASQRSNYDAAREWYLKSLEIKEQSNLNDNASATYFALSVDAIHQDDTNTAEYWLDKAFQTCEGSGDANSVNEMGWIAERAWHYTLAERLFRKGLEIATSSGKEFDAVRSCLSLERIAATQGDFVTAVNWCRQALKTNSAASWRDWLTLRLRLLRYKCGAMSNPGSNDHQQDTQHSRAD
ncbi:MAG: tetratricopeptide repeat protein [Planctomycetota bacterium]